MAMFLTVAAVIIGLALVVVLLLAARRPDTFSYGRSVVIKAPAELIFPLIADPVQLNTWNPFNEEPSIKGTYSGPPRGPGARYTFESRKAGTGYTEIVDEQAPRHVGMRLVMTKPMACDNKVAFDLEPAPGGTKVTWSMAGDVNFMGKLLNQFIDCDRMCGDQFTRGLTKLKSIAELQRLAA